MVKEELKTFSSLCLALFLAAATQVSVALDFPHVPSNAILPGISCLSCHDLHGSAGSLLKASVPNPDMAGDDTEANNLCWSCHTGPGLAPYRVPHSSDQISDQYGTWNIECKDCHNPHNQPQIQTFGSAAFLATGTLTSVTQSTNSTLTDTSAAWTVDEHAGRVVFPDTSARDRRGIPIGDLSYRILSNTATTLTLDGVINTGYIAAGDTYGIVYGKIIRNEIQAPADSSWKQVKFFSNTGNNSFADDDATLDGVCQVCHTKTGHFKNDGTGADQMHTNADRGDITGTAGDNCTEKCHLHIGGFGHGKGNTDVTLCIECHGHEEGTIYDPDGTYPYYPNGSTLTSRGFGSVIPHTTHTESWHTDGADWETTKPAGAGDDDLRGPGIYCSWCHDTANMPTFRIDGAFAADDVNADGIVSLDETSVCNDCHSVGGDYNGVNSEDGSVGAKDNWHSEGIYDADYNFKPGKEKWCAGCHDKEPSHIVIPERGIDITAPKVIGDEEEEFRYGTGWGFYKTGHGTPSSTTLPATGGIKAGPDKSCTYCHQSIKTHIDGDHRTFDCSDGCDSDEYGTGYRMRFFAGSAPMEIPRGGVGAPKTTDFRLCLRSGCHGDVTTAFTDPDPSPRTTNFYDGAWATPNLHYVHLTRNGNYMSGDWSGDWNTRITCIGCHNPHGTKNHSMIRTGELSGNDPIRIWFYNASLGDLPWNMTSPNPDNVTLGASDRSILKSDSVNDYCYGHCHGGGWRQVERDPFQVTGKTPLLNWAGVTGYEQDGVNPDAAVAGTTFKFMVQYQDYDNDLPTSIDVWVDANDNGSYEDPAEKFALTAESVNPVPVSGDNYTTTVTLNKAGDNLIKYTFSAADADGAATGVATGDSTLQIQNTVPTLDWTAESESYTSDGVHSDNGPNGGTYQFRINYTDLDGDTCPASASASIQVWIDSNDNGYEAGEKFNLLQVDGDADCTDGKLYYYDAVLSAAGSHNYRFYATDGGDDAVGTPAVTDGIVTVAADGNTVPVLSWATESCLTEGAKPPRGANGANGTLFEFKIKYTDEDNQCPAGGGATDIQVWIDENKDGYTAGEKHNLSPVDGDADCTTAGGGKLYNVTGLALAVNQDIPFEFHATDGVVADNAIGVPVTTGSAVDVYSAKTVKAASGDYTTIQAAMDAINGDTTPTTLLVDPATYGNLSFSYADNNWTIISTCGADSTIIDAGGSGRAVFTADSAGTEIDGFTVTNGGTDGIVTNGGSITVRNSKIHGNAESGVELQTTVSLIDSEIYSNGSGGIRTNGGTYTFTNLIIRNNTASNGAGIFWQNLAAPATVTNVTIKDNSATSNGGAMYTNGGTVNITDCTITGNSAVSAAGAWYLGSSSGHATVTNCVVADNTTSGYGGGFTTNGGTLAINNSTLVGNVANGNVGGMLRNQTGPTTISNSIIWNNSASGGGHVAYSNGGSVTIADSIIQNDGDGDFSDGPYLYSTNITFGISGYTSEVDPAFVDASADDYKLQYFSGAINNAGADAAATDRDGNTRTVPDIGAYEFMGEGVGGGVPTLAWTGETDFAADGVNPDSAVGGSNFEFRVDYTDAEGNAPSPIELWIDEDGDSLFDQSEKYAMAAVGGGGQYGDSDYTNGERYTKSLALVNPGGGTLNYRIVASDGIQLASGLPADLSTVEVTNRVPTVAWPGDTNYESDGVDPDLADSGDTFTFRVLYTDADNTAPVIAQVWIDENDSSFYDSGEYYDMAAESGAGQYRDGDYSNGEYFTFDRAVAKSGDGRLNYRFAFSDGVDDATGDPASQQKAKERYSRYFTVNNFKTIVVSADASAASDTSIGIAMAYTGDENSDNSLKVEYGVTPADTNGWTTTSTAVHPASPYEPTIGSLTSGESYDVKMTFTDADGVLGSSVTIDTFVLPIYATTAGTATAVVADETSIVFNMPYSNDGNNNNTYTVDYKLSSEPTVWTNWVTDATHAASPYSDTITSLTYSESYDIRMTYTDADGGGDTQTVSNVTLPIVLTVCPSGCDYTSIQAAIDVSATGNTVLVMASGSPYSENIVFDVLDDGVIVKTDGGVVTIQGASAATNEPVVKFADAVSPAPVLDGFTIDNQMQLGSDSVGIRIEGGASPTIKNSIIAGNTAHSTGSNEAGGISIFQGGLTLQNSRVGSTIASAGNSGEFGGGIYATTTAGGPYNLTITNSTITYNTANSGGGGVYFTSYNGTINLTDTVVDNNTAANKGGGVLLVGTGATVTLSNSSVSNNSSTSAGGAGIYSTSPLTVSDSNVDSNVMVGGKGGGIYMFGANSALTMTGGTVSNHSGITSGAGIYSEDSTAAEPLTITNTTVSANTVTGNGGGIFLDNLSNPAIFTNVTVSNNSAGGWTGGLHSTGGPLTLSNSTITANSAVQWAGGLYLNATTVNVVDDSIISSNYARGGGGAYVTGGGTLNVTDSTIASNTTFGSSGGGITNNASTVNLTRSYLKGNWAAANGGGLTNGGAGGTTTLISTIVSGNVAGIHTYDMGGGIATDASAVLNLYSSTIAGNYVTRRGGGLYAPAGAPVTIENTIIYGNDAGQYWPDMESSLTSDDVTYSDIGGWIGGGATNPTPVDPIFISVDPASDSTPTTGGDFRLQNSSTLIDIGGGSNVPAYDIENELRPYDGDADDTATPDIGADEMTTGNQAPTLDWLGSGNYTTDGVDPDSASSGSSFTFKVEYTDLDNHPPNVIYVWVDADDSGTFEDPSERTALAVAGGEDGNYANGEIYETSPALTLTTVGNLDYYFEASDGWFAATGSPASTRTVQVSNSLPDTPTNSTPADVATNIALSPTLTGSAFNDADPGSSHLNSQWQVATDSGFASVVYDSGAVTDLTSHTIGFTLNPSTVYYWRVRYRDNLSAWSVAYSTGTSFTTTTVPNTPTNSTPADVATGVSPTPTLTASAFSDPNSDSHQASRWQVDNNADFSSITYDSGSVGDLVSHTVGSALSEGAVYYWRVSYQDNKGAWSNYSTGTSFTTNRMPNTPSNSTPADAATGVVTTPTLTASAFADLDGGDTHAASQWQVDDNADFSSISYDSGSVVDLTSHTLGSSLNGVTVYYWRVRYQDNNGGWSSYSTNTSFTTQANPPNTPTNSTPADTATGVSVTPTLTGSIFFDPDPGDTHQASQWQVDDNADFSSITYDSGTVGDLESHIVVTPLLGSTTYYWRVRYQDAAASAWSSYSMGTSFTTGVAPIYVCSSETPPFDKIQTTIADAGTISGDTISVCAGTYAEKVDFLGKNITLVSVSGAGLTTITGNNTNAAAVNFTNSETTSAVLDGFTIDNVYHSGSASRGIVITGAEPTIKNSVIEGIQLTTTADGAGVYINGGGASISDTAIQNNTARHGVGIYALGAINLSIANSTIDNNSGTSYGGGMRLNGISGTVELTDSSVSNNTSLASGAGIYFATGNANAVTFNLTNTTIDNNSQTNTASYDGGGIYMSSTGTVTVQNITATITNSSISNNTSRNGGGMRAIHGVDLTITGTTINGNVADASGGGLYVGGTLTTLDMSKSTVAGNDADVYGGGMYVTAGTATITNCMITGNHAYDPAVSYSDGGGFMYHNTSSGTLYLYNSTVTGNYALRYGGGVRKWSGNMVIGNSIVWGNNSGSTGTNIYGAPTVSYSNIGPSQNTYAGSNGNIDANPIMVDMQQASQGSPAAPGDYRLCNGLADPVGCASPAVSPSIDTGTYDAGWTPSVDFEGGSRPYDVGGIDDGVNDYDMGADEYGVP